MAHSNFRGGLLSKWECNLYNDKVKQVSISCRRWTARYSRVDRLCLLFLRLSTASHAQQTMPIVVIFTDILAAISDTGLPWQNFLTPAFWTKSEREVPLFLELHDFSYNTVWDESNEAYMPKISSIHWAILAEQRLVTDRQTQDHGIYCASTVTRGKKNQDAFEELTVVLKAA